MVRTKVGPGTSRPTKTVTCIVVTLGPPVDVEVNRLLGPHRPRRRRLGKGTVQLGNGRGSVGQFLYPGLRVGEEGRSHGEE